MLAPVSVTPKHLESYRSSVREGAIEAIQEDAAALIGARVLHVNQLLSDGALRDKMGAVGHEEVRDKFLITRYLHDYVRMFLQLSRSPGTV